MACPGCSKRIDRHVAPDRPGATPRKGDVAVCFYCGMICTFVVSHGRDQRLAPIKQHEYDRLDDKARASLTRVVDAINRRNQAGGFQS